MSSVLAKSNGSVNVLRDSEFKTFREYFYRQTGIYFADSKRYFVDKRILERISATGHKSFRSYFTFVRFERQKTEFQYLTELMTVNETYFFREEYQFKCLVHSALDEIVAMGRGRPIRIWSMPCSTGEEPYSMAIYLLEHWPKINQVDIQILASDIDTKALASARAGLYAPSRLKNLTAQQMRRYFVPEGNGFRISESLRSCVTWSNVNLSDPRAMRAVGDLDIVFCRNLLIYFDDASRRTACAAIFDALAPGGFVFLGHSESMSRFSPLFIPRKFPDALIHQKPLRGAKP